jgi:hypothetical protein
MPLIKLNIDSFKKDAGGIAGRLIDNAVSKIEGKLENAVEDAFAKGLKKIGLSNSVSRELAARFTDSLSAGRADKYFDSQKSEQSRATPRQIEERLLARQGGAVTTLDAVQSINNRDISKVHVMQFPEDLGKYYMMLDFQSYHRPSPQMEAIFKRFRTIALPIPRDLKETFALNVDGKEQGVGGGLADIGTDLLRGAGEGVKGQLFALAYSALVQKAEGAGDIVGQIVGAVPNPHLQAIFSGVDLREHTFQWTFAPRNPHESETLMTIIREIKKNSLPAYSTQGTAALQYPPMVELKLMPWNADDSNDKPMEGFIKFKKCLIKSVSVNYAPAGLPSFFRNTKLPTMIQLELQFLETEIQTAADYGLKAGDREDGLEQLKEALDRGASNIAAATGFDYNATKNQINTGANAVLNGISEGARDAQAGRERDR